MTAKTAKATPAKSAQPAAKPAANKSTTRSGGVPREQPAASSPLARPRLAPAVEDPFVATGTPAAAGTLNSGGAGGAAGDRVLHVPVDHVATTPVNPRTNFGDTQALTAFGQRVTAGQLEPVVIVPAAAYLQIYPEHKTHVGVAPYVLANGERRLRGVRAAAAAATIEAVLRPQLATNRKVFAAAVLDENVDRESLDPIEQAHGVKFLVEEFGSHKNVATHYGYTPGWVTHQLALLGLTSELQELIRTKVMPVRAGRMIGKLPAADQPGAWEHYLHRHGPTLPDGLDSDTSDDEDEDLTGAAGKSTTGATPTREPKPLAEPQLFRFLRRVRTDVGAERFGAALCYDFDATERTTLIHAVVRGVPNEPDSALGADELDDLINDLTIYRSRMK